MWRALKLFQPRVLVVVVSSTNDGLITLKKRDKKLLKKVTSPPPPQQEKAQAKSFCLRKKKHASVIGVRLDTVTGGHSKWDQILLVKIGKYSVCVIFVP